MMKIGQQPRRPHHQGRKRRRLADPVSSEPRMGQRTPDLVTEPTRGLQGSRLITGQGDLRSAVPEGSARPVWTGGRLAAHLASLPDHLDQHPLRPSAVELAVEDLLPGAEVELAVGDRHDDLAAHDLPLHVGVGVVLAGAVVVVALRARRRTGRALRATSCSPRAGPARRR